MGIENHFSIAPVDVLGMYRQSSSGSWFVRFLELGCHWYLALAGLMVGGPQAYSAQRPQALGSPTLRHSAPFRCLMIDRGSLPRRLCCVRTLKSFFSFFFLPPQLRHDPAGGGSRRAYQQESLRYDPTRCAGLSTQPLPIHEGCWTAVRRWLPFSFPGG